MEGNLWWPAGAAADERLWAISVHPPPEFSEHGFLKRRGALNVARTGDAALADAFIATYEHSGVKMERFSPAQIAEMVQGIDPDWSVAVYEPNCSDIDVAGLHGAYLRGGKRRGVALATMNRLIGLTRSDGIWTIVTDHGEFSARNIVNAAGAWADNVAQLAGAKPLGLQPLRRTMVQLATDPPSDPALPQVIALDESFYFKPEAGGSYWVCPHDEIPSEPTDAAPEEYDIALAIDRFQKIMPVTALQVTHKWAGLRTFAPDRLPVIGWDGTCGGFFWFAGQGGFGIQTAPAAAMLGASQALHRAAAADVAKIDPAIYRPARFG
ncbi:MAG: FAD-binding oxidoreductase [Parasphingorhabdus sp.]|nr:FAD-binding oxidoreductase [Parasphingorhabdus sp.]